FPDAENEIFIQVSFGVVDSDVYPRFPTFHDDEGSSVLQVPDVGFDEEIDRDDGARYLFADLRDHLKSLRLGRPDDPAPFRRGQRDGPVGNFDPFKPHLPEGVHIGKPFVLAFGHLEKGASRVEAHAEGARQFDLPGQEGDGGETGGAESQFDPIDVIGGCLQQIEKGGHPQSLVQHHGQSLAARLGRPAQGGIRQLRIPKDFLVPFHRLSLASLFPAQTRSLFMLCGSARRVPRKSGGLQPLFAKEDAGLSALSPEKARLPDGFQGEDARQGGQAAGCQEKQEAMAYKPSEDRGADRHSQKANTAVQGGDNPPFLGADGGGDQGVEAGKDQSAADADQHEKSQEHIGVGEKGDHRQRQGDGKQSAADKQSHPARFLADVPACPIGGGPPGWQGNRQDQPYQEAVDPVFGFQDVRQVEKDAEQDEERARPGQKGGEQPFPLSFPCFFEVPSVLGDRGNLAGPLRFLHEDPQGEGGGENEDREGEIYRVPGDEGEQSAEDGAEHFPHAVGGFEDSQGLAPLFPAVQVADQGHGDGGGAGGSDSLEDSPGQHGHV